MTDAYYNEIDPYAAQWLRNLIAAGHIAPGDVDERSIVDVRPDELANYTQCHFFAGIGGWSLALRLADWPDARPVWTGSCPCQSFSAAGKGLGTRDEKHLWPEWFRLIRDRRPIKIFGEQVASTDGLAWLDIVCTDLENEGYPVWPIDLCAAGVGAPNIRQRLWFMADPNGGDASAEGLQRGGEHRQQQEDGRSCELADPDRARRRTRRTSQASDGRDSPRIEPAGLCATGELADTSGNGRQARGLGKDGVATIAREEGHSAQRSRRSPWADPDWLQCTDGKARPVEPGTFPLAHGVPNRVGRLRGYGNAINPEAAAEFISATMR